MAHGDPRVALRMRGHHELSQTENPKGIPQQSPGLPSLRGHPGIEPLKIHNPERVAPDVPYRLAAVHGEPRAALRMHGTLELVGNLRR